MTEPTEPGTTPAEQPPDSLEAIAGDLVAAGEHDYAARIHAQIKQLREGGRLLPDTSALLPPTVSEPQLPALEYVEVTETVVSEEEDA